MLSVQTNLLMAMPLHCSKECILCLIWSPLKLNRSNKNNQRLLCPLIEEQMAIPGGNILSSQPYSLKVNNVDSWGFVNNLSSDSSSYHKTFDPYLITSYMCILVHHRISEACKSTQKMQVMSNESMNYHSFFKKILFRGRFFSNDYFSESWDWIFRLYLISPSENSMSISDFLFAIAEQRGRAWCHPVRLWPPLQPAHKILANFTSSMFALLLRYCAWYEHTSYLSFFLHRQNFWRIKFTQ